VTEVGGLSFVGLGLRIVMQNDGHFVDVILLYSN
jgi:hypothetical protein